LIETFNEMITRLDQSFRQIKQFSSDASHELKTPLTILKGEVEVMLRKERTSQEYQQTLKSNLEEINRMSQIVEDLLLLSRADTGEIRVNRQDINLTEILADVVAQMDLMARSKKLHLSASNHHQEIHIFGDALRIRELFINLIENGIKYTEEGGSIHITLQEEYPPPVRNQSDRLEGESEKFVRIIVSDTGIGIAEEDRERIFNRFFRVDKARSREQGGSGLGLSICKWIVEAHQGEIKVESELGKGSSFIVRLPLSSPRLTN
jgi:signal transduction histidine kinase